MSLTDFPGVGDALAERLVAAFGSEDAFRKAAEAGEVARIAAVEGVSHRKAVEWVLTARGRAPADFLRTPRAEALYEDILARIAGYANTAEARDRIALLVPLAGKREMEAGVKEALAARDRVRDLHRDEVASLLKRIHRPKTARAKFDSGVAILVDAEADHEALVQAGVDRYCRVLTPEDAGFNDGYEVVVYAYSTGVLDLAGVDNVVTVPFTRDVGELLPDVTLHHFRENRGLLTAAARLAEILGRKSVIPEVLDLLDRVSATDVDFEGVEALVRDVAATMNTELEARTKDLSLSGSEVLEMMGGKTPKKVRDLQTQVLREGLDRIARETGDQFQVFTDSFPVEVDESALERRRGEFLGRKRRQAFREKVETARALAKLSGQVDAEVAALIDFDYTFAVGSFVHDYALEKPRWGKGVHLQGARHLDLIPNGGTPIEYVLSPEENVVLLTGANSGGKTTLLETVAQAAILAHLGLPVNAAGATLEPVEAVYFFTQKRSLDAGAFESFLKGFIPIVTSQKKKLVLADELEAMTELDAAARIIGTFLELLKSSESYGVCVTHMASEVTRFTKVRVDGIEARGLDGDYNLIVDRTPRMNHHARSTPEFILRRLREKAKGGERKVYDAILEQFPESPGGSEANR